MNSNILLKKYKAALTAFADIFNNTKQKEKHRFIYLIRFAGISLKHAIELGFNVKKKLWINCLNKSVRNKGKLQIMKHKKDNNPN